MTILILCTGNSCRSQMAEAMLRQMRPDIHVYSAGSRPAPAVSSYALRVLETAGYSTTGLYPKHINQFIPNTIDLLISVCDSAREDCPVLPGVARHIHHSFADPYNASGSDAEIIAEYEVVRTEIESWLRGILLPEIALYFTSRATKNGHG